MYRIFIAFLLISFNVFSSPPNTFPQAKKFAENLFKIHPQTIYCHCSYDHKEVDLSSCGMQSAEDKNRAHRIEWEHIMAAEHFGRQFECWRTPLCHDKNGKPFKGRKCCEQIDNKFRHIEAELYNLWPEVGLVNQARSNYRFSEPPGKRPYYGCDMTIDKSSRRVEPPSHAKGIIARAYLFMAEHYSLSLSKSQRQLFEAWNNRYPPGVWEKQWAKHVAEIEGYENHFITQRA